MDQAKQEDRIVQLLKANTEELEQQRAAEIEVHESRESYLINTNALLKEIKRLRRWKESCRLRFFLAGVAVGGLVAMVACALLIYTAGG